MIKRMVMFAAAALLSVSTAWATPVISMAYQDLSFMLNPLVIPVPGVSLAQFAVGQFSGSISVTGSPPLTQPDLASNTITTDVSGAGHLLIFVTEQNLTTPVGITGLLSGFTANVPFGVITVKESTFIDLGNAKFGQGTFLASHLFTDIGSTTALTTVDALAAPFSETMIYDIVATGAGTVNATINVTAPEPGDLAILSIALIALGIVVKNRHRGPSASAA